MRTSRTELPRRSRRPSSSSAIPGRRAIPWGSLLSERIQAEPLERAARLARVPLPRGSIDLASQQPSPDLVPTERFRRCVARALREKQPRCLGYAQGEGLPALRSAIAKDLSRNGVPAEADDVVVTSGSQQALDLLARVLVDPGDTFLVEAATYPGALHLLAVAGARLVAVRCDDDGPDMRDLRRLARAAKKPKGLYLMPNHRNPTGACISVERREALVAWSHEAGVPLVEDDYDADLSLDGRPAPPRLRAMDPDVCHVGTYSKKLIPALRVGYLLCPAPLRAKVVALKTDQDNGTSGLLQAALAEFLDRGYLRSHLARVRREYRARRDALEAALRAALPTEITWEQPERGLFLWIPLPEGIPPEAVYEEARRRGVQVTPSPLYTLSERESAGIRVTFCRERSARLEEGARRLGAAIRAVAGRGGASGARRGRHRET